MNTVNTMASSYHSKFRSLKTAWKVYKYEFFWSLFLCIRTKYRKIRTRKNSVFGHFSRSVKTREPRFCRRSAFAWKYYMNYVLLRGFSYTSFTKTLLLFRISLLKRFIWRFNTSYIHLGWYHFLAVLGS